MIQVCVVHTLCTASKSNARPADTTAPAYKELPKIWQDAASYAMCPALCFDKSCSTATMSLYSSTGQQCRQSTHPAQPLRTDPLSICLCCCDFCMLTTRCRCATAAAAPARWPRWSLQQQQQQQEEPTTRGCCTTWCPQRRAVHQAGAAGRPYAAARVGASADQRPQNITAGAAAPAAAADLSTGGPTG